MDVKLHVDLETLQLIQGPGQRSAVTSLRFKRGDAARLQVVFLENGVTPATIGDPNVLEIEFGIKPRNQFSRSYLAHGSAWTMPSEGDDAPAYESTISFNTLELNSALNIGSATAEELPEITLMGEITWREGAGEPTSSRTFLVVVENDVNRGTEAAPTTLPTPDDWLDQRAIRFDRAQALTPEQMAQALANLGSGGGFSSTPLDVIAATVVDAFLNYPDFLIQSNLLRTDFANMDLPLLKSLLDGLSPFAGANNAISWVGRASYALVGLAWEMADPSDQLAIRINANPVEVWAQSGSRDASEDDSLTVTPWRGDIDGGPSDAAAFNWLLINGAIENFRWERFQSPNPVNLMMRYQPIHGALEVKDAQLAGLDLQYASFSDFSQVDFSGTRVDGLLLLMGTNVTVENLEQLINQLAPTTACTIYVAGSPATGGSSFNGPTAAAAAKGYVFNTTDFYPV